ncbi:unnamed protein product, partial [Closterium sp. NIES-65]
QMAVVGGRGTPPAPPSHLIRPPLPPGPALIPGGPQGQVLIRHPQPPPPTMLLPVGAGSIEAKFAAQHGEIQQLLTENQRLAATHVALRQELAAAQGEIQRTKATLAAVQMEKDQAVRGIMEHKAKLEADLRAVEPLRGELHRARMELQALQARGGEAEAGRAEMQRQMSAMGGDMQRMRSDLEGMRQELMQARDAAERERRAAMEAVEQREKAERTLEATAREVDRLRGVVGQQQQQHQQQHVTPLAVYGLPEDYSERQLVELFRTYGTVVAVQVAREGTRELGYGYVHLDSPTSADIATSALNEHQLGNRRLRVERYTAPASAAQPKPVQASPAPLATAAAGGSASASPAPAPAAAAASAGAAAAAGNAGVGAGAGMGGVPGQYPVAAYNLNPHRSYPFPSMAEAVVIARMRKKVAEEQTSLTRSHSLLEDKFGAYERANRQMWARSSSFADSSGASPDANGAKISSRSPLGQSPLYPHAVSNSSHDHGGEETDAEEDSKRGFGSYTENHLAEQRQAYPSRQTGGLQGEGDGNKQVEISSGGEGRVGNGGRIGEEAGRDNRNGKTQECYGGAFWRQKSGNAWNGLDSTFQYLGKGWLWGESRETSRNEGDGGDGCEDSYGKERGCEDAACGAGRGGGEVEPATRSLPHMDLIREDGDDEDLILANELEEIDKEVVQDVFDRVSFLRDQVQHYRALGGFVLLMALFVAMVYLQADSSRTFQVTSAHSVLIPSNFAPDSSNRFAGAGEFYSWLNNSIIQQFWQDPPCGDGTCDQPFEFPAFGRFGCEADCGTFPNLTSVSIHFTTSFSSNEAVALSSWNLCMQSPISLCWHALPQPFPALHAQFSLALHIPDGQWALLITAPMGGVQGVLQAQKPGIARLGSGGRGVAMTNMGSSNSVTIAAFGGCADGEGFGWGNATAAAEAEALDTCREVCESVAVCLQSACGREVATREVAGAFVDCVKICRAAPATILPYDTMSCSQIAAEATTVFPNSMCTGAHPTASPCPSLADCPLISYWTHCHTVCSTVQAAMPGLSSSAAATADLAAAGGAVGAVGVGGERMVQAADLSEETLDLPHLSTAANVWTLLGSTDAQRIRNLQVAVSRTLYTMIKDSCLAGPYAMTLTESYRRKFTAFLCTIFGGPAESLELCRFRNATGNQLVQAEELYRHLKKVHLGGRLVITSQQLRRFIDILIAAMQSVTALSPDALADLSSFFHRLDPAIVSATTEGCSQGGTWLQWRAGVKHNTTIHVGDKITWVWDDDLPHSLRISGMGDGPKPFFEGFGGHRLALSRRFFCSPMNVGAKDDYDDPVPCVVKLASDVNATFTYTKVFTRPGVYLYESGNDVGEIGEIGSAGPSASSSSASSSASSSSMSGMVTVLVPPPEPQACSLQLIANGVCNPECNTPTCAFDGGDCGCIDPVFGVGFCTCPAGQARRHDGCAPLSLPRLPSIPPCCVSDAVGDNLSYPFTLQRYGPNFWESNHAFAAERDAPLTRFVASHNRLLIGMFLRQHRWSVKTCQSSGYSHSVHSLRTPSCCHPSAFLAILLALPLSSPFFLLFRFPLHSSCPSAFLSILLALSRTRRKRSRRFPFLLSLRNHTHPPPRTSQPHLTRFSPRLHCLPFSPPLLRPCRLHHLAGWCSNGTSRQPFGVNPHYLPSSTLFNPVAAAATATATTAPQAQNASSQDQLVLNPQGLPYGFVYPVVGSPCLALPCLAVPCLAFEVNPAFEDAMSRLQWSLADGFKLTTFHSLPSPCPEEEEGYPLVFDVNLALEDAMSRLQYLADGFYIDNATRSIEVSFITHNGEPIFKRASGMSRLQCLVDGLSIDNATHSIEVSFITHNGMTLTHPPSAVWCVLRRLKLHLTARSMTHPTTARPGPEYVRSPVFSRLQCFIVLLSSSSFRAHPSTPHPPGESSTFVLTSVTAEVDTGGGLVTSFSSLPVSTTLYPPTITSVFLLLLQAVYVLALLWNGVEEAVELRGRMKREGSVLSYLRSGWNWIDMASLLLQWLALITWLVLWRATEAFDVQPRYGIYHTLLEMPQYWAVPDPPVGFMAAMDKYSSLQALINWRSFYFALQGVNLFFLMVRLLKLMDFQPYLGVITRSLALAMPSLLHFFLLTFIVFFCFALYGYLVFGGKMEQFATLPEALFTCFLIILNENATAYFFAHMHGWDLVAGMLFFIAFILLLVFILFNFLIAIIVDAFMTIKDSHVVATSITHDIGTILRYLINRSLGRFSPYSDIMGRLEQLGARNKQQDEAHKRMQRYQSFKRRAKSCFGRGKVCGGSAAEVERAKTMAAGGGGVVAPQRVLQVKGQSIDDISLAMILQRRHAREDPSASLPSPSSAAVLQISPESEQLSHVLLRQFGDHMVRDYSRPQHKPKHGLPQVQEELGKVREVMDELKAMVFALHSAVTAGAGGGGVGFGGEGMLPAAAAGVAGAGGSAAGGAGGHYPSYSASSSAAAVLARSSFSTTSSFSTAQGCFLSPNSLGTPLGTSPARDPFSSPAASSLAASSPFIRNPFAAGNPLLAGHPFATNNPFGTGSPQHRSLVLQRGAARRAGSAGRAGLRGSMGPSNLGRGNQASRQGNGLMLSRVETTPLPHRHSLDGAASGRHGGSGAHSRADGSQQLTDESAAFVHADTMPMPRTRTSSFPYPEPEPRDAQAGSVQAPGSSDGESVDGDGKGSASGEEQSEELSPLTQAARRVSLSEMEEEGGGRMRKRGGEGSNGRGASGAGGSGSVRKSVGFREV